MCACMCVHTHSHIHGRGVGTVDIPTGVACLSSTEGAEGTVHRLPSDAGFRWDARSWLTWPQCWHTCAVLDSAQSHEARILVEFPFHRTSGPRHSGPPLLL